MMMKKYPMVVVNACCGLTLALAAWPPMIHAAGLPVDDQRHDWQCAYPYKETNCQTILLAWCKDKNVDTSLILNGHECSGCEPQYITDPHGEPHLIFATCINRFGAKFNESDFLQPIKRYKEALGETDGWAILDWSFDGCFETWECSTHCRIEPPPVVCVKYRISNWGLFVPNLGTACAFGDGDSPSPPDDQPIMPPGYQNPTPYPSPGPSPITRDNTWKPVY